MGERGKTMGQTLKNTGAKELNDRYERLVARLRARWISHHDAEDLAIEALCKGLDQENLHNPEGWLLTIARHGAITLSRRKKTAVKHREALAHHAARIREH